MLAYCLVDGLTCNKRVYRRGSIFVLPLSMENEFGGLSVSQLATKQRQIYRKELFRFPGDEEIVDSYRGGKVHLDNLSPRQQNLVADKRGEDGVRLQDAAQVLKDKVMRENPTLAEEEGYELTAAIEQVGSVTEYVPAVKDIPAKTPRKTTTRKTSTRKTTK